MNNSYFITPNEWTRVENLSDYFSDVFDTKKGTRIVITKDSTPNGLYSVYVKENFPDGKGKTLGTRCKFSTAIKKARDFDNSL